MDAMTSDVLAAANAQRQRLRDLVRQPETLVMPGAYDGLSARLFESMGFQAIQCASGGIAAGLGYLDGEVATREQTLRVSRTIAEAVPVPANGDGESGYGRPDEGGETVAGYTIFHLGTFFALGFVAAAIAGYAEDTPPLILAAVMLFMGFEAFFMCLMAL